MSNTGTYIYDPTVKRVVKIRETPHIQSALSAEAAWFPSGGTKYFDRMANRWFHSKAEKRQWMKAKGVREISADWHNPLRGLAESRDCRQRKHFTA